MLTCLIGILAALSTRFRLRRSAPFFAVCSLEFGRCRSFVGDYVYENYVWCTRRSGLMSRNLELTIVMTIDEQLICDLDMS
jgi:hypothetical protein